MSSIDLKGQLFMKTFEIGVEIFHNQFAFADSHTTNPRTHSLDSIAPGVL